MLVASAFVAAAAVAIGVVALSWLPVRDISSPQSRKAAEAVRAVTVQGWAFFTKDPHTAVTHPYTPLSGQWVSAASGPNMRFRYALGFDRSGRSGQTDVETIASGIPEEQWRHCEETAEPGGCLNAFGLAVPVKAGPDAKLCGIVGLVSKEPVRWEYRGLVESMPGEVAVADVACDSGDSS
jgi:antimicrobial peptide system SdpA family protein